MVENDGKNIIRSIDECSESEHPLHASWQIKATKMVPLIDLKQESILTTTNNERDFPSSIHIFLLLIGANDLTKRSSQWLFFYDQFNAVFTHLLL